MLPLLEGEGDRVESGALRDSAEAEKLFVIGMPAASLLLLSPRCLSKKAAPSPGSDVDSMTSSLVLRPMWLLSVAEGVETGKEAIAMK